MKKDNRFLKGALVGALAMFCVMTLGGGLWRLAGSVGLVPALTQKAKVEKKLNILDTIVDRYYLYKEDVDEEDLIEGLYAGYLEALDEPYTNYFTEEETKELLESVTGEFFGVGALLSQDVDAGTITITQVYEDSPAEEAGILAEDILIQVDDHVIAGESLDEIVTWIKGEQGTEVTLHVLRDGKELALTAIRDTVQAMTVDYEMKDGQVGYIYIQEFDDVTEDQFREALTILEEQGMKGLVIDIRSNPGGNLDTVVAMLQMLLPEGDIVSIRDRDGEQEKYTCDGTNAFDKPLAVLVNQYSASASEIFSGAIQDYGIGEIIGMTTYGKGVVQDILDLGDGTSMKLTTAEYFLPSGRSINQKGIIPDVEVEFEYEEENPGYDNQLEKALEVVRGEIN
ncbi:S41 family peptidase [Mediterraneibacter agrestimuris]|uniref:S41 family peptidase n=1 Tax=Mediterraneibacter agrestimuris TaxID=2941333 RepID=UPI002040D15F|nr:S41 family peptidase [Mediterraneibacter agrestimuris]